MTELLGKLSFFIGYLPVIMFVLCVLYVIAKRIIEKTRPR